MCLPMSTAFLFTGFQHGLRLIKRLFVSADITSEPRHQTRGSGGSKFFVCYFSTRPKPGNHNSQPLAKVIF